MRVALLPEMIERQPRPRFNCEAMVATCRPRKRAMASSFSLGWREPSPPVMVEAPYGLPPLISPNVICRCSEYGTPTITKS